MNKIPLTTSERRLKSTMTGGVMKLKAVSMNMGVFWLILVSVEGWTYHSDNKMMTWNETREWCQKHYTDIVVVHNENVTHFIKKLLPERTSVPYYWIGLKKTNDNWKWVANGEIVRYENWADKEPNNAKSDESCVELYITNTSNNGKWNDDGCNNLKFPVCHKAQCLSNSCSGKGLCKEQVNNFTCECEPGFSGPQCQTVECFPLLLFGGVLMNCTKEHDGLRSACRVQCPPGQLLLGFPEFTCRADGMWESSMPLMCASFVHLLIALLASVVISAFCGCFCCSICRKCKCKKAVRLRTQQEMPNPAFETEHTPLDGPLCSA